MQAAEFSRRRLFQKSCSGLRHQHWHWAWDFTKCSEVNKVTLLLPWVKYLRLRGCWVGWLCSRYKSCLSLMIMNLCVTKTKERGKCTDFCIQQTAWFHLRYFTRSGVLQTMISSSLSWYVGLFVGIISEVHLYLSRGSPVIICDFKWSYRSMCMCSIKW